MRIITVVGKIDSRALVYPLSRALSLTGLTAVITDDGSYRRLFHGKGNIGTVSNIDISVGSHVDDELIHSLDDSGIDYDNIIIVSSDYIYDKSTAIIVCHGIDRSMMVDLSSDEDTEFYFPFIKKEATEVDNTTKSKHKDTKNKAIENKSAPSAEQQEAVVNEESNTQDNVEAKETFRNKLEREQKENQDKIVITEGIKYVELQIAYSLQKNTNNIACINLKENILSYIYKSEEEKCLSLFNDKNYIVTVSKLIASITDISEKDLNVLFLKEECKEKTEKVKKSK